MENNKKSRKYHDAFIQSKGSFHLDCSLGIFTEEEIKILRSYGHWFKALTDGFLEPFTPKQLRLVKVARKEIEPFSIAEWAWLKYISRKEIEAKYEDQLKAQYIPSEDSFYSRGMVKQLRKTMYKEMNENHRL